MQYLLGYGNPYMVPGVPPGAAMPPQFNGYYPPPHQMPPQQPAPNGAPPMMGYPTPPQGENGQMFASSAPPPPTPPLHEPTQPPTHFTSPPQTRYAIFNIFDRYFFFRNQITLFFSLPQNFGMNGGAPPVPVSGFNPLPQM